MYAGLGCLLPWWLANRDREGADSSRSSAKLPQGRKPKNAECSDRYIEWRRYSISWLMRCVVRVSAHFNLLPTASLNHGHRPNTARSIRWRGGVHTAQG